METTAKTGAVLGVASTLGVVTLAAHFTKKVNALETSVQEFEKNTKEAISGLIPVLSLPAQTNAIRNIIREIHSDIESLKREVATVRAVEADFRALRQSLTSWQKSVNAALVNLQQQWQTHHQSQQNFIPSNSAPTAAQVPVRRALPAAVQSASAPPKRVQQQQPLAAVQRQVQQQQQRSVPLAPPQVASVPAPVRRAAAVANVPSKQQTQQAPQSRVAVAKKVAAVAPSPPPPPPAVAVESDTDDVLVTTDDELVADDSDVNGQDFDEQEQVDGLETNDDEPYEEVSDGNGAVQDEQDLLTFDDGTIQGDIDEQVEEDPAPVAPVVAKAALQQRRKTIPAATAKQTRRNDA